MPRLAICNYYYFLALIYLTSCAGNRHLAYFSNIGNTSGYIKNETIPVIQPGDLLSITVNSLSPESNALFNSSILLPASNPMSGSEATRKASEGYLVDQNGMVRFPSLNPIRLGGFTREEAIVIMTEQIAQKVKSPTVNISYLNFRITVLGEVNKPSTFVAPSEHVNLLEALGLAGDMTAYGQRENVLVIREKGGIRTFARLNLTNMEVVNSPFFYLQQNDVVYVEPDKSRSLQASSRAVNLPIYVSIASVIAILIGSLAFRL